MSAALATAVFALLLATAASAFLPAVAAQQTASDDVQVIGSPEIDISASDNRIRTGTTQTVSVQVANSGDITRAGPTELEQRVTTARNVRFEVNEHRLPDGLEIRSGPVLVGSVPQGGVSPITFTFDVSDQLDAGRYRVPVDVSYDYTRLAEQTAGGQTRYSDFSREVTRYVTLVVEDDPRFTVEAVESEVLAGDTGDYVLRVQNTGAEARNPRLVLTADETGVFFGGMETRNPTTTAGVADALTSGEAGRVTVTAGADSEVTPGSYPVDAVVRYETPGGVTRETRSMSTGLDVGQEQEFNVVDVESDLRVAEDGDLTGTVRNEGPRNVTNAVVVFDPESDNVNPRNTEYAVGDLSVGETATFEYRVSVSSESEDGPKRSSVVVEYRNIDGERRTSESVDVVYDVADERDEFALRSDVSLNAGASTVADVQVTNRKNETLRNVQAQMYTDDPLSDEGNEAYIQRLGPGETTNVTFAVTATGGATPKTYSATIEFRYDDENNESQYSDTYRVPVEVTEPSDGGGGLPWIWIVLAVVVIGAGWRYRDRIIGVVGR